MSDTSVVFNVLAKDNASKTFSKVSGAAKLAYAAVAAGAAALAMDSIKAASDLNETQTKVAQLFGKSTADVNKFASTAATSLGQSKQQALDAASTFGLFGKTAHLSGEGLVSFSTNLVKLAGDMASFNNTSPEQAIEAIGAALRGESEPIRAYGVLLDDATLKSRALSMGLLHATTSAAQIHAAQLKLTESQTKYTEALKKHGKTSSEAAKAESALALAKEHFTKATAGSLPPLTQQQKVLAAQAEIMHQTSAAQGDFARTSTGLANRQRILSAEFANAKASLGTLLLPYVLKGATAFSALLTWVQKNGEAIKPYAIAIGSTVAVITALVLATKAWEAAERAVAAVRAVVAAGMIAYNATMGLSTGIVGTFVGVKYLELAAWVRTTAATVAAGVSMAAYSAWAAIVRGATIAWAAAQWLLDAAMTANPIGLVIAGIVLLVAAVIYAYNHFTWFRNAVNFVWESLKSQGVAVWHAMVAVWHAITAVWDWAYGRARANINMIIAIFHALGAGAAWVRNTIVSGFQSWLAFVLSIPGRIRSAASGMFTSIVSSFRSAINWVIGRWNSLSFSVPSVNVGSLHFGGNTIGTPNIPMLDVGGRITAEGLAYVHRGEEVAPAAQVQALDRGQMSRGGGGISIGNITLPNVKNAREFLKELQQIARKEGGLRIPGGVVTT